MILPWIMAAGINEQPKRAPKPKKAEATGWLEKEFKQRVLYG
jgi:hypothetical protein